MGDTNENRAINNGKVAFCEGRFQDAINQFRSITLAEPENADAWQFLGFALNANQQPDLALSAFQKAKKLDPNNAETHMGIGLAYLAGENLTSAIRHFEETFKLDPDHHMLKDTLIASLIRHTNELLEEGNVEWAKAYIDRAYHLDKLHPEVLVTRRDYFCKIDDHQGAVQMIEELEEAKPDYPGLIQMKDDFGLLKQKERGWLY